MEIVKLSKAKTNVLGPLYTVKALELGHVVTFPGCLNGSIEHITSF